MKKVNAINTEIVVHGTLEKPYYEVQYYDVDDNAWHVGYSSYELSIVCGYIRDYFNIVLQDADFQLVKHGRWLPNKITASSKCSECRRVFADETPYCPYCGKRMDGDEE